TKAILCLGSLVEARAGCVQIKRQDREYVRSADSVDRRRGLMKRQLEQRDAGVRVLCDGTPTRSPGGDHFRREDGTAEQKEIPAHSAQHRLQIKQTRVNNGERSAAR